MSAPNDDFQPTSDGINTGATQDDYVSRTGQKQSSIPVQSDSDNVVDPIDADTADSDAQLGTQYTLSTLQLWLANISPAKDDSDAIDQSNIVDSRTRGAAKSSGTYTEPGDTEGLGNPDEGRSRVAGGVN